MNGAEMYSLAKRLFPICRSITGNGLRETLGILAEYVPGLSLFEVPSGTQVFDWTVPNEWNITDAYIEDENGNRIVSFSDSNLHVVGYSLPVDKWVELDELLEHVYVQEDQPNVVPYVTSYYEPRYGFCMSKTQRDALSDGLYHMVIDSELGPGSLTYGELIIPSTRGKEGDDGEILFSTYSCHPSLANNELSGPCVWVALAQFVAQLPVRRFSYRFVIAPETIGAIAYLSRNIDEMKSRVKAGFVLSCIGDDRTYSYVSTRYGNTLADRAVSSVLHHHYPDFRQCSYLQRASDERQYNAPGVDLPVCTICRSRFGDYPEYHTSADNLDLITPRGLEGGLSVCKQIVETLESNYYWNVVNLCEPQMGKYGLYPSLSRKQTNYPARAIMDFLAYADGTNDLISISDLIGVGPLELVAIAKELEAAGLIAPSTSSINEAG